MSAVAGRDKKNKRRKPKSKKMSNSIDNGSGKMSSWEQQRERHKLAQKLKIEKGLLEKERRKARSDRAEVEKKRELYLKEKAVNDRLAIKYQCEKELWLEKKKRKGHNFNQEFLMNKVAEKIKKWEQKAEDAKQEWINLEAEEVEMKGLEVGIGRDTEQLKIDREMFVKLMMEFEVKSKDVVVVGKENEKEKARLQDLEDPLVDEEKKLDERIQKYNAYDLRVEGRENVASQKDEEQNIEGLRLKERKQRLLATLGQRKGDFNDRSNQLYELISTMDESFAEMFDNIVGKEEKSTVTGENDGDILG